MLWQFFKFDTNVILCFLLFFMKERRRIPLGCDKIESENLDKFSLPLTKRTRITRLLAHCADIVGFAFGNSKQCRGLPVVLDDTDSIQPSKFQAGTCTAQLLIEAKSSLLPR